MGEALERLDDLGYERRGEGGDLANHGPMGAEALACMGFTDEVAGWVERYKRASSHYGPPQPREAIEPRDESSWRSALGQMGRAGDWEQLFELQLHEQPWRAVLIQWWPRLLPGLLASLTHGLIRTAHAVRSVASQDQPSELHLRELARGLAFWAARYSGLPGESRMTGSMTVAEAVANLPRVPVDPTDPSDSNQRVGRARGAGRRLGRLQHGENFPGYYAALGALAPDGAQWLLSQMTSTFAGVYLAHPEAPPVPLVHGVTAPAAVRLVLPHLPDGLHASTIAAMWHVHVGLLLAFTHDGGTGEGRAVNLPSDAPSAPELMGTAFEHGDEHVIKFTEACLREHALYPDARFSAAAVAAARRIPIAQR
ncbi:MAG TPA: hypothetical protein VGO30_12160 [Mycobacterium sp.]|nr:hypothetical protein [Mycobacterium sp.]